MAIAAKRTSTDTVEELSRLSPREAAERIAVIHERNRGWLDVFSEQLDRRRAGQALTRILEVWGMSQSEAARLFGVTRQALNKWMSQGVPPERAAVIADLAAATDLLVHYLKRDRIPAVVRRPIPARGDDSMLDLIAAGEGGTVLALCRQMFDFDRAQQ